MVGFSSSYAMNLGALNKSALADGDMTTLYMQSRPHRGKRGIHPPAASSRTEGVPARLKRQDRLFAKNLITEEEFKVAPPGFSPNCS